MANHVSLGVLVAIRVRGDQKVLRMADSVFPISSSKSDRTWQFWITCWIEIEISQQAGALFANSFAISRNGTAEHRPYFCDGNRLACARDFGSLVHGMAGLACARDAPSFMIFIIIITIITITIIIIIIITIIMLINTVMIDVIISIFFFIIIITIITIIMLINTVIVDVMISIFFFIIIIIMLINTVMVDVSKSVWMELLLTTLWQWAEPSRLCSVTLERFACAAASVCKDLRCVTASACKGLLCVKCKSVCV